MCIRDRFKNVTAKCQYLYDGVLHGIYKDCYSRFIAKTTVPFCVLSLIRALPFSRNNVLIVSTEIRYNLYTALSSYKLNYYETEIQVQID